MTSVDFRALPHVLYRAFDIVDDLIYVGISMRPGQRWTEHAAGASWFADIAKVTFEHHPTRESVLAAERKAIENEKPRENVQYRAVAYGDPARRDYLGRAVCPGCGFDTWSERHQGLRLCRPCDVLWDPDRILT